MTQRRPAGATRRPPRRIRALRQIDILPWVRGRRQDGDPVGAAAIYLRISQDRYLTELGVDRQEALCLDWAARAGWPVVMVIKENDSSALKPRPKYEAMLDAIGRGEIDAVICWDLDRLHRRPKELERFIELVELTRIDTASVSSGQLRLNTPDGRAAARLLCVMAMKSSEDLARRQMSKQDELADFGKRSGGGQRPFGYNKTFVEGKRGRDVINEVEAAIIRDCAERFIAGESIRSLVMDLNDRGIRTPATKRNGVMNEGNLWSHRTLWTILKSARISGRREQWGVITAEAVDWDPIITVQQSDAIRAIMAGKMTGNRYQSQIKNLLAGFLRCGREGCGALLLSHTQHSPDQIKADLRRYGCYKKHDFNRCGRLAVVAPELEAHVKDLVLIALDSPVVHRAIGDAPIQTDDEEELYEAVRAAEASMGQLAAAFRDDKIGWDEWQIAREGPEMKLKQARARLDEIKGTVAVSPWIGKSEELRMAWDRPEFTLEMKRRIIATVADHFVILPALKPGFPKFNKDRVRPVWRPAFGGGHS